MSLWVQVYLCHPVISELGIGGQEMCRKIALYTPGCVMKGLKSFAEESKDTKSHCDGV